MAYDRRVLKTITKKTKGSLESMGGYDEIMAYDRRIGVRQADMAYDRRILKSKI